MGSTDPPLATISTDLCWFTALWVLMSDGRCRGLVGRFGLVCGPPLLMLRRTRSSATPVCVFVLPTGLTALNSKPRGRRYVKNTGDNRNSLYSRAIHCPASMEKHYVQWFFLRVCRILWFVKKIRFCLLESGRTKPWCPGLVSRPSAKA